MELTEIALNYNLEMLARIFFALFLGSLIGIEREHTHHIGGLRTQSLVSVGACVFCMMSLYAFAPEVNHGWIKAQPDPSRVAAQIVSGVGFIGGGVVLKHGLSVYGLTTAASLWVSASIGMACGAGQYWVAIVTTIAVLLVLIFMRQLENKILKKPRPEIEKIKITIKCPITALDDTLKQLKNRFEKVVELNILKSTDLNTPSEIQLTTFVSPDLTRETIQSTLTEITNITSINIISLTSG